MKTDQTKSFGTLPDATGVVCSCNHENRPAARNTLLPGFRSLPFARPEKSREVTGSRSIVKVTFGEPKADKPEQEGSGENGHRKHWHLRSVM